MTRPDEPSLEALEAQAPRDADAVEALRARYEALARAALGVDGTGSIVARVRAAVEAGVDATIAREASARLAQAESMQWTIGAWSTGSGEGLASMAEVRALQIAQAWLVSTLPGEEAAARADGLLRQAEDDPNRIASRYADDMAALRRRWAG
ncbi:MAG: hypothetical protein AB7S26_37055 [Sandaracinaceae bacterium]